MATRRVFFNGQWAVLEKQPDAGNPAVLWKVSQQDGTVGLTTAESLTAKGPAVLKISAALLRGPKDRQVFGSYIWFRRTVEPNGLIRWEESGAQYDPESTLGPYAGEPPPGWDPRKGPSLRFYSDRATLTGWPVARFNDLLDRLWRTV